MIFYLVAAIVPLLIWYLGVRERKFNNAVGSENSENKGTSIWLVLLGVLPMFLMFVLRNNHVGGDTAGYVGFLNSVRDIDFFEMFVYKHTRDEESGYLIYVKLISYLTNSYTIYFLINGLIIFGSFFRFAIKYTKNPLLFFFFFAVSGTYTFVLTGLRQALAMSIALWAFDFVKKKKFVKFALIVVLSSLFHKSSVICLMIYPLARVKKTDQILSCYISLAVVLLLGFSFFQDLFNQLIGYDYKVEETGNGMIALIMYLLMFVLSVWVIRDKKPGIGENSLVFHMSAIAVLFWVLRLVSRTAERISYYFIAGLYAYFATASDVERSKFAGVMKWMVIVGSFLIYAYRNIGAYYAFFF